MRSIDILRLAGRKDRHQDSPSLRSRLGSPPVRFCACDRRVPDLPFSLVVIGRHPKLGQPPAQHLSTPGNLRPAEDAKPATEVAGCHGDALAQIGHSQGRMRAQGRLRQPLNQRSFYWGLSARARIAWYFAAGPQALWRGAERRAIPEAVCEERSTKPAGSGLKAEGSRVNSEPALSGGGALAARSHLSLELSCINSEMFSLSRAILSVSSASFFCLSVGLRPVRPWSRSRRRIRFRGASKRAQQLRRRATSRRSRRRDSGCCKA